MTDPRRTFGPVVLVGLLASGALAFAGSEAWFASGAQGPECGTPCVGLALTSDGQVPAANALGLVALACWGIVLVSRGRARRLVTVLGLLSAAGSVAAAVSSYVTHPDDLRRALEEISGQQVEVHATGWFWVGSVAAVLGLVAWSAAVRWVPHWPEMGRRYDAPSGAAAPPEVDPSERSSHDLWKVMDEGRDPTS